MKLKKGEYYHTSEGEGYVTAEYAYAARLFMVNGDQVGKERAYPLNDLEPCLDEKLRQGDTVRKPNGELGTIGTVFTGGAYLRPYRVDVKFKQSEVFAAWELTLVSSSTHLDPLDLEDPADVFNDAVAVIEDKLLEARAEVERLLIVQRALRDGRKEN